MLGAADACEAVEFWLRTTFARPTRYTNSMAGDILFYRRPSTRWRSVIECKYTPGKALRCDKRSKFPGKERWTKGSVAPPLSMRFCLTTLLLTSTADRSLANWHAWHCEMRDKLGDVMLVSEGLRQIIAQRYA